jgi:hypothetical protein
MAHGNEEGSEEVRQENSIEEEHRQEVEFDAQI